MFQWILKYRNGFSYLILLVLAILAQGCGGGGSAASYTVSTSSGANGSISPSSARVNVGQTTSFTVTPDTGYVIDNISGCNGSQEGNTYITGSVTEDCTVTASFRLLLALPSVTAFYATNGINWNDYIKSDGMTPYTASDTAADGLETGGYNVLLHGGEMRVIDVPDTSDCTDLTAEDDLNAFNWICVDTTNPVRMVSAGLKADKHLSNLISFTEVAWKLNRVTVYRKGAIYGQATPTTWWSNPIIVDNGGSDGSGMTEGDIRIITVNPAATYIIGQNKVALLVHPEVTLTGSATTNENIISASSKRYLWVEGALNITDDARGIDWDGVRFSVLHNVKVDNGDKGVFLLNSSNNVLSRVTAVNNNRGISLHYYSSNNILYDLTASNNVSSGVYIYYSFNNTLSDVIASNNGSGVFLEVPSNTVIAGATSSNNAGSGFYLVSYANNNILLGVAAANNGGPGLAISTLSNNNLLMGMAVSNNDNGIYIDYSVNTTISGMTTSNNNIGIYLSFYAPSKLTGRIQVGHNGVNCLVENSTGLNNSCQPQDSSDFGKVYSADLTNSFMGKVAGSDILNISDTNGLADFPASSTSFDWSNFDNRYRTWGWDGSVFPSNDHRGKWTTGTGRIWDWSLASSDTVIRNIYTTIPAGDDTLTHAWDGVPATSDDPGCDALVKGSKWNGTVCETTFLNYAMEIVGDKLGNENGLCESNETCLFMPNMGSYQGHGNLISVGVFTDGALDGITLMKYETNGR